MKRIMIVTMSLMMTFMMLFAFTGCGGAAKETPADQAAKALDTTLAALKSADKEAIQKLGNGKDIFGDAEKAFGSEDGIDSVLKAMFGHFDYTIGKPEQVDDKNVNVPVKVTNADMSKAVNTWFSDLMAFAMKNPDIAKDEKALQAKTIEMLQTAVDNTAKGENGTVSKDVTFPMVLTDGKWAISDKIDDSVLDAVLGGFMTAIKGLTGEKAGN